MLILSDLLQHPFFRTSEREPLRSKKGHVIVPPPPLLHPPTGCVQGKASASSLPLSPPRVPACVLLGSRDPFITWPPLETSASMLKSDLNLRLAFHRLQPPSTSISDYTTVCAAPKTTSLNTITRNTAPAPTLTFLLLKHAEWIYFFVVCSSKYLYIYFASFNAFPWPCSLFLSCFKVPVATPSFKTSHVCIFVVKFSILALHQLHQILLYEFHINEYTMHVHKTNKESKVNQLDWKCSEYPINFNY